MQSRDFNHYYLLLVCGNIREEFPRLVSYNRFKELMQSTPLPLVVFQKIKRLEDCTGITFIDSTPIKACHLKREHSHQVRKGLATKRQCTIDWLFGLKLHSINNDNGEILDFTLTPERIDDRKSLNVANLLSRIHEKLLETMDLSPNLYSNSSS
jgi:hypothetical protein